MSDDKRSVTVNGGGDWIACAIIVVFCYGDPDLLDALIHYLMAAGK